MNEVPDVENTLDMRASVSLLTRNIKFESEENNDAFGGSFINYYYYKKNKNEGPDEILSGETIMEGVEFVNMG